MSLGGEQSITYANFQTQVLPQAEEIIQVIAPSRYIVRVKGIWRAYNITDIPQPAVKTIAAGAALTSDLLQEVRLVGLGAGGSVLASIPVSGTVSLAVGSQVRISTAGNTGPTGGQFTTNGLGTAQQLNTFANPSLPSFASSFVLENLDAINTVYVGPSTVTNAGANIGFPITKGLTGPTMLLCQPTALYIVDNGNAVTMAWWVM